MKRSMVWMGVLWMCAGQTLPAPRPLVIEPGVGLGEHVDQMVVRGEVAGWGEVLIEGRVVGIDETLLKKMRWEVRSADETKRVGELDLHWEYEPVRSATSSGVRQFTPALATKFGEGTFVAAWVVEDRRVSNVVAVRVDKKHRMADEAAVVGVVAEPAVKGSLPLVGLGVVRRAEADEAWTPIDLLSLRVMIDGAVNPQRGGYSGGNRAMAVGEARTTVRTLDGWKGTWTAGEGKTVSLVHGATTVEVKSDLSTPLGDGWDEATGKLGPAAATQGGGVR